MEAEEEGQLTEKPGVRPSVCLLGAMLFLAIGLGLGCWIGLVLLIQWLVH